MPESPGQAPVMADETRLQSQKQNLNDRMVVLQNNNLGEGVMINILSSDCIGATVNKLERVISRGPTAQPSADIEPPLARQLTPVEHDHGSVVFRGNTLHEHAMINICSHNCMGADANGIDDPEFPQADEILDEYKSSVRQALANQM
ncbi:uncharacterized protein EDB91DRAFT_1085398 [Suillus paluster]|uniref:uncharacterized protein n=1 Tax=Suillus paluster TaxID=48578 RepID=UPI001B871426|nr:uncharacterized protein EDB91DRAFT_1085398 [Suillus paluster]KAG1730523.1 hypothetical protein EDB91DRAFT_1085398 [Suillus paluster]